MKCGTQTTDGGRRTHRGKDRTTYTQRGRQSEGYSNMKASLWTKAQIALLSSPPFFAMNPSLIQNKPVKADGCSSRACACPCLSAADESSLPAVTKCQFMCDLITEQEFPAHSNPVRASLMLCFWQHLSAIHYTKSCMNHSRRKHRLYASLHWDLWWAAWVRL